MTYCVGLKLNRGLVMAADTRTNAGVDNIACYRKLHLWEKPGERVFMLLTAGNLAVSQAVVNLLSEQAHAESHDAAAPNLFTVTTMFQAARIVGQTMLGARTLVSTASGANSEAMSTTFIFGGQIGTEPPRLFQIYSEGNFIEAGADTPYFQIGEHKYGKPILDRVVDKKMRLGEAAKIVLLSFDSTIRSNLSVGMPIDMVLYNVDTLKIERQTRIEADDRYFNKLSSGWSKYLRDAVAKLPEFDV